jgi:hypothetical protein
LKVCLQKFLTGDYHNVVMFWRKDFDMAIAKQRHKSPDTAETRADQAAKLAGKGFYSRAVRKPQSKGFAHGPGVREQMKGKHPVKPEHDWPPPAPATVDMAKL